jgi:hypothetical protein
MDPPSGTSMALPFSPGCSRQRILAPGFSELGLLFLTAEEFHRASPHSTLCFYRRSPSFWWTFCFTSRDPRPAGVVLEPGKGIDGT